VLKPLNFEEAIDSTARAQGYGFFDRARDASRAIEKTVTLPKQ